MTFCFQRTFLSNLGEFARVCFSISPLLQLYQVTPFEHSKVIDSLKAIHFANHLVKKHPRTIARCECPHRITECLVTPLELVCNTRLIHF